MKPIIFVLGLSGAGKDEASKMLEERCSLLRKDMDRKGGRGFRLAGFPAEWDRDISLVDFAFLAAGVCGWLGDQHQGAVLSFPTTYRFSREQLGIARTNGVGVVLLWGPLKRCWVVRRERQEKNKGTTPDHADYLRKNRPTFEMYERGDFGDVACAGLSRRFPVGDPCWGIGTESPTGSGASHPGAGTESCVQSGDGLGEA